MWLWLPTGNRAHDRSMGFEITLRDHTTEFVGDADTFAHEKVMTTFYQTANARQTIDCWSVPLASVRTDQILMVKRVDEVAVAVAGGTATVHHLASA